MGAADDDGRTPGSSPAEKVSAPSLAPPATREDATATYITGDARHHSNPNTTTTTIAVLLSTPLPTPETTCPQRPMSKWRLRGYVQDSDEDDEDDLESTTSSLSSVPSDIDDEEDNDISLVQNEVRGPITTNPPHIELEQDIPSSGPAPVSHEVCTLPPTDSPHIKAGQSIPLPSSSLGPIAISNEVCSPVSTDIPNVKVDQDVSETSALLVHGSPTAVPPSPSAASVQDGTPAELILTPGKQESNAVKETATVPPASDLPPLSSLVIDRNITRPELSTQRTGRPPSPIVRITVPANRQRPIQEDQNESWLENSTQVAGRSLRTRKPIQLHPFLFDDALHRRAFTEHGLKPVRIRQLSSQKAGPDDTETHEKDFRPDDSESGTEQTSQGPDSLGSPHGRRRKRRTTPATSGAEPSDSRDKPPGLPKIGTSHPQSGMKRRKLVHPPTPGSSLSLNSIPPPTVGDIWDVPLSPPYSSSPLFRPKKSHQTNLARNHANTTLLDSPLASTPLESGKRKAPVIISGSESSTPPRSARAPRRVLRAYSSSTNSPPHSARQLRRGSEIALSDSPSLNPPALSSEEIDSMQIKKAKKRIKGVLPASWLRLDLQAQDKRKEKPQIRKAYPESSAPQRGVAQKVPKRGLRQRTHSPDRESFNGVIVIPDDSEEDSRLPSHARGGPVGGIDGDEPDLVLGGFDDSDTDLEHMENDRLHLFTLGGNSRTNKRRKVQSRVTDNFVRTTKKDSSKAQHKISISTSRAQTGKRDGPYRQPKKAAPKLSIMDSTEIALGQNKAVPQFIRVAIRQARQRPDNGRDSPGRKILRLQTAADTSEVNASLQAWRTGSKLPLPSLKGSSEQEKPRHPLEEYVNSRQRVRSPVTKRAPFIPRTTKTASRPHSDAQSSTSRRPIRRPLLRNRPVFRTAQLEGLASDFSSNHRNVAFSKGLSRVDHQFAVQTRNPQIDRYLAAPDPVPLPVLSVHGVAESVEANGPSRSVRTARLTRKRTPQRVETDVPEYRQPSEPAPIVAEGMLRMTPEPARVGDASILQGLGPHGTRYPTTFDVTPLDIGTFFHSSTFIGSGLFQKCLSIGQRNLDTPRGYYSLRYDEEVEQCGPWNDSVASRISHWAREICHRLEGGEAGDDSAEAHNHIRETFVTLSEFLRSLNTYISTCLSFLDSIDRRGFAGSMRQLVQTLFDGMRKAKELLETADPLPQSGRGSIRGLTQLVILAIQSNQITQNSVVDSPIQTEVGALAKTEVKYLVCHVLRRGFPELQAFLDDNKSYRKWEDGIRGDNVIVESIVVCMHASNTDVGGKDSFWKLVNDELNPKALTTVQLSTFESLWSSIFTLLPFTEFDSEGLLSVGLRFRLDNESWILVKTLLIRLFLLYPDSFRAQGSSLNAYVRAVLRRCHTLIKLWGWKRCDAMLGAVYDFFARNGFRNLQREDSRGSPPFLEDLHRAPSLEARDEDNAFHIFLKCLALGLRGMGDLYPEKRFRSMVWRYIPNHGRSYPKEEDLNESDLDALRNHHDLLTTLYWAAPPSCRPRLSILQNLVQLQSSHRAACRLHVRAWTVLSRFQVSTDEPYSTMQPFALWHKDIVQQSLLQYRLAKTEAEIHFRTMKEKGSENISFGFLQQMIRENQSQVIVVLQDAVVGMNDTIRCSSQQNIAKDFLVDSEMMHLLELYEMDDPRLVVLMRETLKVVKYYTAMEVQHAVLEVQSTTKEHSQASSEDSQEYGEWPDLEDLECIVPAIPDGTPLESISQQGPDAGSLDFIRVPLWHLLSNAFGAERPPDDEFLMECVDAWVSLAKDQVMRKQQSWDRYIGAYSLESWHQLRDTAQSRKFGVYFMSSIIECDYQAYKDYREEFLTAWLLSLVEHESLLKFQHRLTETILNTDSDHPLLRNLPFVQDSFTGSFEVTTEDFRTRRLALISSILANMRDAAETSGNGESTGYASMLRRFMLKMKNNYQELQQGTSTIVGAYVDFVQTVVQFLSQYTLDICPVDAFFTDSASFPLPTSDPHYVVGRLCGFATKLADPGCKKQLATFVQRITQQAAVDNLQDNLVHQLCSALSGSSTEASNSNSALRTLLLVEVFPAYIEAAFVSYTGLTLSKPILEALKDIIPAMHFDLRLTRKGGNVRSISKGLMAVFYAFVKGMDVLVKNPSLFSEPHVLHALVLISEIVELVLPLLNYIHRRTGMAKAEPIFAEYFEQFADFAEQVIHDLMIFKVPSFEGKMGDKASSSDIFLFTVEGLRTSMRKDWVEEGIVVYWRQGATRKEVIVDVNSVEEERDRFCKAVEKLHAVLRCRSTGDSWGTDRIMDPSMVL